MLYTNGRPSLEFDSNGVKAQTHPTLVEGLRRHNKMITLGHKDRIKSRNGKKKGKLKLQEASVGLRLVATACL